MWQNHIIKKRGTSLSERAFVIDLVPEIVRIGGDSRIRTGDMLLAKQPLYQLSYIPTRDFVGGSRWNRTIDLVLIRDAL